MRCNEVEENLSQYIDGELTDRQVKEIDAHLMSCQECKKILEQHRIIGRETMQLAVDPPKNLMENVMKGISPKKPSYLWKKFAGVAVASILILFGLVTWNNNIRTVSADEIVLKMASTLDNLNSYHVEINFEETIFKGNEQTEVKKGKIVEYMKKPYYQRIETDFPYKEVRIANGEKEYYSSFESQVHTNPMGIPYSRTFRQLDKNQILKSLNKKNLKLIREVDYKGRTAYEIQGKIIDFQLINADLGQGSPAGRIEAKVILLIDKETSVPIKTEYFRGNEKKPYRQMVYTMFKLNEPIDNNLFDIPSAQNEFPGWRPVKDIETARTLIKEKIDLPQYLPAGAKLNRIGYANRFNIRVEYLVGKNVIYITYGRYIGPEGEKRKIGDIWFDNVAENFWSSNLSIQKDSDMVSVEGTLPLQELSRIASSILTPEEKKSLIEREKLKVELIKKYKVLPSDIKPVKTKFTGKIESLKITAFRVGESASGEEKHKSVTLYKAPFYIYSENNWGSTPVISVRNNNKYLNVQGESSNGYRLSFEPLTSIYLFEAEDENVKSGVDKIISRKVVGSAKYIKRPVTIVEYTYNYPDDYFQGIVDFAWGKSSKSTLYVDDETGIILKRLETINGQQKEIFYVTEFLVNPEINQRLFEIPDNLKLQLKNGEFDVYDNKYQEVTLDELKKKPTVTVKIPRYLPEGTKLINISIFNQNLETGKYEALQLYSVKNQPLIIYSRRKDRGEDIGRQYPQTIEIAGIKYYYRKIGNKISIESTSENLATHIESTIPLEELKKIIESLQG